MRASVRSFVKVRSGLRRRLRIIAATRREREFGPREVRGIGWPPLRHRFAAHGVHARRHVGREEVAVAVVLVLVAPRVLPVVEDLAAEDVSADAPGVLPAALRAARAGPCRRRPRPRASYALWLYVGMKPCAIASVWWSAGVSPRSRRMNATAGDAVGKHLHVARDEAEVPRVPRARGLKSATSSTTWPSFTICGGAMASAGCR